MKLIFYNNPIAKLLPDGYSTIMLCGIILTKLLKPNSPADYNKPNYCNPTLIQHEFIHVRQWLDYMVVGIISGFLYIFLNHIILQTYTSALSHVLIVVLPLILFYIAYGAEYCYKAYRLYKLQEIDNPDINIVEFIRDNNHTIYESLSFEREAYSNEHNNDYIKHRRFMRHYSYF